MGKSIKKRIALGSADPLKDTTESPTDKDGRITEVTVDGMRYPVKYWNDDGSPRLVKIGYDKGKPIVWPQSPGRPRETGTPDHPICYKWTRYQHAYASPANGEKGKRDLWFLASKILSNVYPDLNESLHKPMCDFFVKKDPKVKWHLQDHIKNRLLLEPRGHFKTTIDLCDIIQWMLAFPDVTIVLFSGTQELTTRMVDEVKQHFLQNGNFREMYPQWVPQKAISSFGEKGMFTLPCRKQIRREPTLSITTLKSTRAGSHYDVEKFDDVVTELNSNNKQNNAETTRQWSLTQPLLNPGGYRDVIGTLYSYDCFYAPIIERDNRESHIFERTGWKVKISSALKRDAELPLFRPEAVLFPDRFCVDENRHPTKQNLEQIYRDDPELFSAQYMNDPASISTNQFSMSRLKQHTVDRADIPSTVNLYMTWDLAYSTTDHSDYSVGVLGGFSPTGSLFVVDVVRGRFRPAEIIENIIQFYRKWPICRVGIEQDSASRILAPGLESRQREMNIYIPIDLIAVKLNGLAPEQQVLALGPLLETEKLWFCRSSQHIDEMFREFSRFPKYAHDDICRAVSLLMFYRHHGYRPELAPNPEPIDIGGAQTWGSGEGGAGINCG